jgi:hypothetical protein
MEESRDKSIREAIQKYGPITDRWVLRLGKSEEEAGKFEPWHQGPSDFEEDFAGFLACLSLTRLVDSVNERMKTQKKWIRGRKKEQKEAAKLIAREQEKLAKALAKAENKRLKEIEKVKIKEEARLKREADKAAKKLAKIMPVVTATVDIGQEVECTSLQKEVPKQECTTMLVTIPPKESGIPSNSLQPLTIKEQEDSQESLPTTLTEVTREEPRERRDNGPRFSDIERVVARTFQVSGIKYEDEPEFKSVELPGEK